MSERIQRYRVVALEPYGWEKVLDPSGDTVSFSDHARLLQQAREAGEKAGRAKERDRCRREVVEPLMGAFGYLRENSNGCYCYSVVHKCGHCAAMELATEVITAVEAKIKELPNA